MGGQYKVPIYVDEWVPNLISHRIEPKSWHQLAFRGRGKRALCRLVV